MSNPTKEVNESSTKSVCYVENMEDAVTVLVLTPANGSKPWNNNATWGMPGLFWGPPGIGKSNRVENVGLHLGMRTEVVYPATQQPEAVAGALVPDGRGGAHIVSMLPGVQRLIKDRAGILFIDELSCARPAVQAAFLGLPIERRIGEDRLPGGVRVLSAANPPDEAAGGWDLEPPMANRFVHFYMRCPPVRDWCKWLMEEPDPVIANVEDAMAIIRAAWKDEYSKAKGYVVGFHEKTGYLEENLQRMPKEGDPNRGHAWPSPRCYTSDTEVMTHRGWVPWPEVLEDDLFATRSPEGDVHYSKAVEHIRVPYTGQLIRFTSQYIDLAVTPNHNMFFTRAYTGGKKGPRGDGKYVLASAESIEAELNSNSTHAIRVPKTGNWNEPDYDDIDIGGRIVPPMEAWAELLGWVLSDSYIAQPDAAHPFVSSTQMNPEARARIANLLEACGAKPYYAPDRVGTTDEFVWSSLKNQGRRGEGRRCAPRAIMNGGPRALAAFIRGAFGNNGYTNDGQQVIKTGPSSKLAADIQEAALRLGGVASIATRKNKEGAPSYIVHIWKTNRYAHPKLSKKHLSRIHYNGEVHCARVPPHSTLLVKQNGHACWCGNTWEMATRLFTTCNILGKPAMISPMIHGCLGRGLSLEFETWLAEADLPSFDDIINGKWKPNPKRIDKTVAAYTSATSHILQEQDSKKKAEFACEYWKALKVGIDSGAADIVNRSAVSLVTAGLGLRGGPALVAVSTPVMTELAKLGFGDYV